LRRLFRPLHVWPRDAGRRRASLCPLLILIAFVAFNAVLMMALSHLLRANRPIK
jgi:hypothetical protein